MTDDTDDVFRHDDLRVNDDGFVEGTAYTHDKDGYDVVVGVTSYEYERDGETKMNHVPNVVVNDPDGSIVAEPHSHDSSSAEIAIENAKSTGKWAFRNMEQYMD